MMDSCSVQSSVAGSHVPCLQMYPGSSLQVDEQPSKSRLLPSSHSSSLSTRPSPHVPVQPLSVHCGSAWQISLHPSKGVVLSSSHVSEPSCTPSPQTVGVQTLGDPSHLYPISNLQVAEQPG